MYRGQVTAVDSGGVFVLVPELHPTSPFGPLQTLGTVAVGMRVVLTDAGDGSTPDLVVLGGSGGLVLSGTGSPEGTVSAPVGSLYERTDEAVDAIWSETFEDGFIYAQDPYPDNIPGHFKFWQADTEPVTSATARTGTYSGAFTVAQGGPDWPGRCEVVPDTAFYTEGDDATFTFSTRLGSAFDTDSGTWQVIVQWKSEGIGSPPLEMSVDSDTYYIGGGYGWPGGTDTPDGDKLAVQSLGAATVDTWVDWVVHVVFSSDPDVGYVEVWKNGTKVLEPWKPPGGTLYPNLYSYLKIGYYRDDAIATTATVYHDAWSISVPAPKLWVKQGGGTGNTGWLPVLVDHDGTFTTTTVNAKTVIADTTKAALLDAENIEVENWATLENLEVNGTLQSWLTAISTKGIRLRVGGSHEFELFGFSDGNLWLGYNATFGTWTRDVLKVAPGGRVTVVQAAEGIELGEGGPVVVSGSGAPTLSLPNGSLYLRTDGGAGTTLYVRESGSWAGK